MDEYLCESVDQMTTFRYKMQRPTSGKDIRLGVLSDFSIEQKVDKVGMMLVV